MELAARMSNNFQPSVFQNPEGKNFADPRSDRSDYYWVTVFLPEHIDPKWHTDEEIMEYALKMFRHGRCAIHEKAMHGLGQRCISLPIKRNDKDTPLPDFSQAGSTHPDVLLVVDLAAYWHELIWTNKIILDKDLIFVAKRGKAMRIEDMMDVGLDIMDIWRI